MRSTVGRFNNILSRMGSDVVYHREQGGEACPCQTENGFRDPTWHLVNAGAPVCNESGILPVVTEFTIKASIQPVVSTQARPSQRVSSLLGDVKTGDRVGILPCSWQGNTVDLDGWSDTGSEYLLYDGKRYTVVATDKLPDVDGNPAHHYECGLRLLSSSRPAAEDDFLPDPSLLPSPDLLPVEDT